MKPSRQTHLAAAPVSTHCVFGPHAEAGHSAVGRLHGTWGGFPTKLVKQKHTSFPFDTVHSALGPHWFTSQRPLFRTHFVNGFPLNPFGQLHIAPRVVFSQSALSPQGDGLHGSEFTENNRILAFNA
jgi:hypothetical protein